ncbi:protein of unknown function [Taphrina deformans PYCC 5710]|uniref:Uncharacterized protein n=1 Tax=Taphrina deformans (strain PYCC 5710 / ATCC 11124 / CBS 356.35 / IMI 108563 / JCM 9778 / NBRC 8474) TaxID=1097556 RepID=R4XEA3_TAPDE|nr:protein of unknown function [Taphrina deformans PYCC 5710]|eukprot:CCG81692.1 protein of unknown function [Taphrina deformans PYCC 5710]
MPNTHDAYTMHAMDVNNSAGDNGYDQEESLLQAEEGREPAAKRVYQNSDRTLILLGAIGSIILAGLSLTLVAVIFGKFGSTRSPLTRQLHVPRFGDIGCEFPGEVISPTLEQNLTLLDDSLEIVTSGRAVGDIMFHTEAEDGLEYVRMDIKVQGPQRGDLHAVYTRVREGRYELQTPEAPEACMRYTLEIWLPRHLTTLTIRTDALTHLSFAGIDLDSSIYALDLRIGGDDTRNLLWLPEARIANAKYALVDGSVVGTTLVYNTLRLDSTQAQVDVELVLMRDEKSTESQFHNMELLTSTTGLHRVRVRNPDLFVFEAHHESSEATEMVLSYPASFTGGISMSTKTLTLADKKMDIARDKVTYIGSRDAPMSDLRVRNDLGSVWLAFE